MNILTFSDWRSQPIEDIFRTVQQYHKEIDLIIYAGDDLGRFLDDDTNYLDELAVEAGAELGFVRGNDDEPKSFGRPLETERVHDLHSDPYKFGNFIVLGQEGAIGETAMGFTIYDEEAVEDHLEDLVEGHENRRIILVTHTPPYGILDLGRRYGERRLGSEAVRTFAEEIEPDLIVCGHVHQFGGRTRECDFSTIVNIASHDHDSADGRVAFIEVTSRGVSVSHKTTDDLLKDPLTKLTQVGDSRAKGLRSHGFEDLEDLTQDRWEDLLDIQYIHEWVADRILSHAAAYRRNGPIITDPDTFSELRDRDPILVDIETNLAQDTIWLVGAYNYTTDKFVQFFDPDDEATVCESFYEYVHDHESPTLAYYAGQGFDERMLTERTQHHGNDLSESVGEWQDICNLARKSVFVPDEGHDLDTIATGLGYDFTHPDMSGFDVGAAYAGYRQDGTEPEWDQYLEYNQDDVLAMKHVVDVAAQA
jgi:Icc-related predicted phosphoesterase